MSIQCMVLVSVTYMYNSEYMAVKKNTSSTTCTSSQGARNDGDVQKDTMLSHLLEMGFDYKRSLEALQTANYDLTNASAILTQQSIDYGLSSTPTKASVGLMEDSTPDSEPTTKEKYHG